MLDGFSGGLRHTIFDHSEVGDNLGGGPRFLMGLPLPVIFRKLGGDRFQARSGAL